MTIPFATRSVATNTPVISWQPDQQTNVTGEFAFQWPLDSEVLSGATVLDPLASIGTPTTLAFDVEGTPVTASVTGFDPTSPAQQAIGISYQPTIDQIGKDLRVTVTNASGDGTATVRMVSLWADLARTATGHPAELNQGWTPVPPQPFTAGLGAYGGGIRIPTAGVTFSHIVNTANAAFAPTLQVHLPAVHSHVQIRWTIDGVESDDNVFDGPAAPVDDAFNVISLADTVAVGNVVAITVTGIVDAGFVGTLEDNLPLLTLGNIPLIG